MTATLAAGALLLVLPIAYNALFTILNRTFDYPDILRRPTSEVLARFQAGGSKLVLAWWAFAMTALVFAVAVALLSEALPDANRTVVSLATTMGVLGALVQLLGLIRWPFAVPYLARTASDPATTPETLAAIDVTFQTLNRLLGVGIGEHLGYLLTGVWTALAGTALVQSDLLNPAYGAIGIALAPGFIIGSAEFIGPNERNGWRTAGTLVPIAYVTWSLWLFAVGVGLVLAA